MTNAQESFDIARKWTNFLQGERVLCPNDCCASTRGRTLMMTAIFFNGLSEEERQEHLDIMDRVIEIPATEGMRPHISWDGLVFSCHRSRQLSGKVHKARREVSRGLVNASG